MIARPRSRSIAVVITFVITVVIGLAAGAAAPSSAEPAKAASAQPTSAGKAGPGTQAVRSANETIGGLLKQKAAPGSKEEKELAAKVTTSVRGFLDIDQLGKRAMVDNWQKL